MRLIIFAVMLFTLSIPALAKKTRKPSNNTPRKVFTFVCKDENEVDLLIGITNLSVDMRDPNAGIAQTSAFVKRQKDFHNISFSGRLSFVPGGFVLIGKPKNLKDAIKLNVHPNEQTLLPGMPPQNCMITGQLEST